MYSGGTEINNKINPDSVRIMKEKYNIDMSNQYSKLINDIPKCDIYVSMGCNVKCPFVGKDFNEIFNIDDPTVKMMMSLLR